MRNPMTFNHSIYSRKIILLLALIFSSIAFAQVSNTISSIKFDDAKEGEDLKFFISFYQPSSVSNASLLYRVFGEGEFQEMELEFEAQQANGMIPASNVKPPSLEYYVVVELKTGQRDVYPLGADEGATPAQVTIAPISPKDKEIIFLSPEKNVPLPVDEFFVSISFVRASSEVDIASTKIYLNDVDVSDKALLAEDLILLYPENFDMRLNPGYYSIRVELYDKQKNLYHKISNSFPLISSAQAELRRDQVTYGASIFAETRNEKISDVSTSYNNVDVNLNAAYRNFSLTGRVYATSEEDDKAQPYNRYSVSLAHDYFILRAGDFFPRLPSFIMSGKRMRGYSARLTFGAFNLHAAAGEITRGIEGSLLSTHDRNYIPSNLFDVVIDLDSIKYGKPKGTITPGTFKRNLAVVRPYFGEGESFQFGLTYMHAKDDMASIDFGSKPEENLLLGGDLLIGIDEQRILLTAQGAVSILNSDISVGTISDELVDSLTKPGGLLDGSKPADIKKYRDLANKFITVNQNLKPLNIQEYSSAVADVNFSLNYFGNYLKVNYTYRGNDYKSFGNNFVRTDVAGINISDRLRLIDNKLFIAVSYEDLGDNLQKTKNATTHFKTMNSSVSYYPRTDFPNISIGYKNYVTDNSLPVSDTLAVNDKTDQISAQLAYNFDWTYKTNASLSFATSNRTDNSYRKNDISNVAVFVTGTTVWTSDLNSNIAIGYNQSKLSTIDYNYLSLTVGAKYSYIANKLLFNGNINPNFGDFDRLSLDADAQYFLYENWNFILQLRYLNTPGGFNDFIYSLSSRYRL